MVAAGNKVSEDKKKDRFLRTSNKVLWEGKRKITEQQAWGF